MRRASLFLLLLTVLWAVDAVVGEGFFWAHDLRHHHLPWRVWAAQSWKAGQVPLWSADVGMGFPLMADGQTGAFYLPTMLLFMFTPPHWAVNLSILLHLWWGALGATWMARRLDMGKHGALLTGVAFGFSGFIAAHTGYLGMQNAVAWLPWGIGALVGGAWAAGGLCMAMMLVAGHPQIAAIGLMLTAAVAIWRGRWRGFAVACAFALVAASPQLLATLELVEHSLREGGVDAAFANIGSLPPQELLNGALPALFGMDRPGDVAQTYFHRGSSYWGQGVNHWEMSFYLGLPAIVLALIGARGRRFWPWVCGLSGLLMLGGLTPAWMLLRQLPGLEGFRFPVRFSLVLTLGVAVLAGHGLERVLVTTDRRVWARRVFLAAGLLLLGLGLARLAVDLGEVQLRDRLVSHFEARGLPPGGEGGAMQAAAAPRPEAASPDEVQTRADQVISELKQSTSPDSQRVIWPVLVLVLLGLILSRLRARTMVMWLTVLLYMDLWAFGAGYNIRSPLAEVTKVPEALRLIEQAGGDWRTSVVDRRRSPELDTDLISSSMGLVHGIRDVQITSPLRMVRTEALLSRVGLDVGDRGGVKWDRLRAEGDLLDLIGVRWLLSEHRIEDPGYPLRQSGEVHLYENPNALPGAIVVGCSRPSKDTWRDLDGLDPGGQVLTEGPLAVPVCPDGRGVGSATLTRVSDVELVIVVDAARQAMLVQTDTHYPGWVATVDGDEVPLHRVDLMFRGVIISPGLHEVVLRYRPSRITSALWAGLGSVSLLTLLAGLRLRRRRKDASELRAVLGRG